MPALFIKPGKYASLLHMGLGQLSTQKQTHILLQEVGTYLLTSIAAFSTLFRSIISILTKAIFAFSFSTLTAATAALPFSSDPAPMYTFALRAARPTTVW